MLLLSAVLVGGAQPLSLCEIGWCAAACTELLLLLLLASGVLALDAHRHSLSM